VQWRRQDKMDIKKEEFNKLKQLDRIEYKISQNGILVVSNMVFNLLSMFLIVMMGFLIIYYITNSLYFFISYLIISIFGFISLIILSKKIKKIYNDLDEKYFKVMRKK
jgi:positive regulator of sigma E activity